jgi:hypothetical protein
MSGYTVTDFTQAAWLVYINGLEIPVVRIDLSFGLWQPSTAQLHLIPHQTIQRLGAEDRLQVAIFYLDTHWNPDKPEFCLLGEYEITGWSYQNSPYGRTIVFNCASQLSILSQLHFFYISSIDDIAAYQSLNATDPTIASVVTPLYPASLFRDGLTGASGADSASGDDSSFIKRPIDFVLNLFRAFLYEVEVKPEGADITTVTPEQSKIPPASTSAPGKNFYARWLKMTGFHRRWAALPVLEDVKDEGCFPVLKAAQETQVLEAIQQQVGQSVGNSGTAWDLLNQVLGYMLMEIVTIPAPPASQTEKKTCKLLGDPNNSVPSIPTFFVKPQCYFSLPPTCNVIFPSMLSNFNFTESYTAQPTRVYLGESFISTILNSAKQGSLAPMIQAALVTGYPEEVRARQKALLTSGVSNNKNFLLYPEEFYKGPMTWRLNAPAWMYLLSQYKSANTPQTTSSNLEESVLNVSPLAEEEAKGLGVLFDKYAEYEFYRQRYAATQGGTSIAWNPYIIPGFPCVVFDQDVASTNMLGYVTGVTHSLCSIANSVSMSTNVSIGYMRLLDQMATNVVAEGTETSCDMHPEEPIKEIGTTLQNIPQADAFYRKLLFGHNQTANRPSVFNWRDMVTFETTSGATIYDMPNKAETVSHVVTRARSAYAPLFTDYTSAMQYVARPVATLKDYVETYHQKSIQSLLEAGAVVGEQYSFYSDVRDKARSSGAVYWVRIYKLIQGPMENPGVTFTNIGGPPEYASAGPGNLKVADPQIGTAQTRRDWDTLLEEYRIIIRGQRSMAPLN